MADLGGGMELEVAADLVVRLELVAETLQASNASAATNSGTSERTALHQHLAEAMRGHGNVTGAIRQATELRNALRHHQQLEMLRTLLREVQGGGRSADIATLSVTQLNIAEKEHLTWL